MEVLQTSPLGHLGTAPRFGIDECTNGASADVRREMRLGASKTLYYTLRP